MFDSNKSFLGQGWSFPPSFSKRNKTADMISYEDDIHQSLIILLSTQPGERLMHPTFGCGLHKRVFDNINLSTITQIKGMVERAILFFEPRIKVNNITVQIDDLYEGKININVDYTIRTTNTRTNLVYPFYFDEATDI